MSFVDAIYDRERDTIHVVERKADGSRVYQQYPATYTFYYDDPKGKYRTIYGDPVSRFSSRKRSEFQKELRMYNGKRVYESDFNPVFRCLAENYLDAEPPTLHTCFFDIEVEWKSPEVNKDVKVKIRRKQ